MATPDAEEAAFRAAEATYRAYVDALNARRANPASPVDPETYLDAAAASSAESTAQDLLEAGMRVVGPTKVVWVAASGKSRTGLVLRTCVDLSQTRLMGSENTDVTPASRPNRQVLAVTVSDVQMITDIVVEPDPC
ncbi:hypothetical protein [Microbacterium oleivorans]|nr:hypothetical protein [Microbacterium oleivorans]